MHLLLHAPCAPLVCSQNYWVCNDVLLGIHDSPLILGMGHLLEEIKSLIDSNFLSFECVFKGRECNQAAHDLAVLGFLCTEVEEQIMSFVPDSMSVIVAIC